MENYKLVLPEHLNHYGYLFGGYLLQWVDEAAWICASLEYPSCRFVTVGMDKVEFRKSVRQGTILRFGVRKGKVGSTSVQYSVQVFSDSLRDGGGEEIFSTTITFVCLDEKGTKAVIREKGHNAEEDSKTVSA
jgi:acyl-CoA hydrolase